MNTHKTHKAFFILPSLLLVVASGCGPGLRLGQTAPDFEMANLGDQKVHLAQYKGSVVLLNFWSTW